MRLVGGDPALRCPHPPASAQLWEARLGQQLFLTASFGDHTDEIQWPASAQQACGASSTSFRGFCSVFFPVVGLEEPLPFVHFSDRPRRRLCPRIATRGEFIWIWPLQTREAATACRGFDWSYLVR